MTINNAAQSNWSHTRKLDKKQQFCRGLLFKLLDRFHSSSLTFIEGNDRYTFGDESQDIEAVIVVHDPAVYQAIAANGSMGAAESYMQGHWTSPDLTEVIRAFVVNLPSVTSMESKKSIVNKVADKSLNWVRRNTLSQAKKNIVAHYDLSNEFFSLWLDPSMMYSSAVYPNQTATLVEASEYKLQHICERLQLKPSDHLVEVGTGWGGMAIYAAKHYGCKVTTTTISDAQYDEAEARIKAEGLESQITLLNKDYRLLEGQFDKLVSVEMIEAVGHQFFDEYFEKCSSLLKPDGLMLIQAITIADQRFEHMTKTTDFIRKYIFPGGCLPSVSVINDCVRENTDMLMVGQEDITEHYAKTLKDWRLAFFDKIDEVRALGFDDVFIRMWEYYLCYCEGGFIERAIGTSQFVMAKPRFKGLPAVRH